VNNPDAATPDENLTARQWLARNGPTLLLVAALLLSAHFYFKLDAQSWWNIGKVAIGLGLVIFIHELGHFLVAKWCDVHVQTFSIGFGPALPGCSFQWGETTYKVALFPLGGYVQMVGQVDGHEESDGSEDDPRSYKNKTVWQRMAIISAGVTMNVILAVVCFVVVFQGPGKDRKPAIVDIVEAGSPAATKGLQTGAVITKIGDVEHPYFEDLMAVVMATRSGQRLPVTYQIGTNTPVTIEIEPRLSKVNTRPMIGIAPPPRLQFEEKRFFGDLPHPTAPHSAASRAQPPFGFGDVIVATTDPDQQGAYDPARMRDLPPDPRKPGSSQRDYFEFSRRMQLLAGKEVTIRVLRGPEGKQEAVDIKVPPAFHYTFGARMRMGQIVSVREGSSGQRAGVQARDANRSLNGDIIEQVELPEPDDRVTTYAKEKDLDPVRLPFLLRQWAARWAEAEKQAGPRADPEKMIVTLHVLRHNADKRQQDEAKELHLKWDRDWQFDRVLASSPDAPLPIPELGIAYQVLTTVVGVEPNGAGPLQPGDVIKEVGLEYYAATEDATPRKDEVKLEPHQWAWIAASVASPTVKQFTVKVERGKEAQEFTITTREDQNWPQSERGLERFLAPDLRRQKADNFVDAVALGLKDTKNTVIQVFQNLRGIFEGRISVKNLGGPVTIARIAFLFAGVDFWEFVFFLGLISINLAVINFLPIPVLDGGHMVFLLYEKIRGKPASEQVRVGATYAGLLLLAGVMVFVLYLDFSRMFH
jgi:regulator of sigma E protease